MIISKKVSLFFLSLLICAFSLAAHQDHQTEADSSPKIAAWNNQYEIPGVGSYQLPKLGFAGDGEVLDTNQAKLLQLLGEKQARFTVRMLSMWSDGEYTEL